MPLDYANPGQGTIGLPVSRARATGTSQGVLVFNAGGPFIPSSTYIRDDYTFTHHFSPDVIDNFDIVAFDARGTTQGIACFTSDDQVRDYDEIDHLARTTDEVAKVLALEKEVNQGCLQDNAAVVRHADTASTVRDTEQLRLALGVTKFSFYGDSYGTFVGSRYAALYPGHLRAMILDGAVDHGVSDYTQLTESAVSLDEGWHQFIQWCQNPSGSCRLRGQNIDAALDAVLTAARAHPLPAPRNPLSDHPANDWVLMTGLQYSFVIGTPLFGWVEEMIVEAQHGDGSTASYIYDALNNYNSATDTYAPGNGATRTISCEDSVWSQTLRSVTDVQQLANQMKTLAPRFGEDAVYTVAAPCFGFPQPPAEPSPVSVSSDATGYPVLIISGTNDRQAPIAEGNQLHTEIAGSRLLVRDGDRHISAPISACVQEKVTETLVKLTLPAAGTHCATDPLWEQPVELPLPPAVARSHGHTPAGNHLPGLVSPGLMPAR